MNSLKIRGGLEGEEIYLILRSFLNTEHWKEFPKNIEGKNDECSINLCNWLCLIK